MTLAVTETFDAGLLGEHILETLDHAWSHLLANPAKSSVKPRVIPGAATVYICAIECEHIRKENRWEQLLSDFLPHQSHFNMANKCIK